MPVKTGLLLVLCFFTFNAYANFEAIKIPGAVCGNGGSFSVFYKKGDQKKLAVEFMGGGACWSASTCYGPNLRAWFHQLPKAITNASLAATGSKKDNPFYGHSFLYIPYCTGDVFAGKHTAKYRFGIKAHHQGYSNTKLIFDHLIKEKIIEPNEVQDLGLFGASAGALGALIHGKDIEARFPNAIKKTLIADSPGLHWGQDFWNKFSPRMLEDIIDALAKVNLEIDTHDGFIAELLPEVCSLYRDFNIGFLQGSKDVIMTLMFGNISTKDHEKLIYSERGLYGVTQRIRNCKAWVPQTHMHTFLLSKPSGDIKAGNKTAIEFSKEIYRGNMITNYR
ncbi:MAG: hypothetical protein EP319_10945 [Deltaproteobacteria bacterium]|nr:MAG: hypothetical protein EP319_10945 [Deltaproteobacteria bacterium]